MCRHPPGDRKSGGIASGNPGAQVVAPEILKTARRCALVYMDGDLDALKFGQMVIATVVHVRGHLDRFLAPIKSFFAVDPIADVNLPPRCRTVSPSIRRLIPDGE